jgi:hypothetical protein
MSSKPTLTVTADFTKEFNQIVKKFRRDAVLVGIPSEQGSRKETNAPSNAQLLATCQFGSPARNIPPWDVMGTGIRNAQDAIAEEFGKAAKNALTTGFQAVSTYYNRAGIIASNSIKKVINSQENVPDDKPSKATLRIRKARGFKGKKYWLVTGQMRNAITYVVKEP